MVPQPEAAVIVHGANPLKRARPLRTILLRFEPLHLKDHGDATPVPDVDDDEKIRDVFERPLLPLVEDLEAEPVVLRVRQNVR
jgi:hypothetical protein